MTKKNLQCTPATRTLISTSTAEVLGRRLERKQNRIEKLQRKVAKLEKENAELKAMVDFA